MRPPKLLAICLSAIFVCCKFNSYSQAGPKVLVINAHPDDETSFPIILYKITHDLHGTVDLALITDGQGGFNGSELGSVYYGLALTDSVTGRSELPRIRKKELMQAGDILGIRQYYFFDQKDDYYHLDPLPYVNGQRWDIPFVEKKLDQILAAGKYDFIITMMPFEAQHGHHKTAVIMALRAIQRYKGDKKPIILAGSTYKDEKPESFTRLNGFPETEMLPGAPAFTLDVATRFGYGKQVSYKTVAQWVIACYKSQGDMQENDLYKGDREIFRLFAINPKTAIELTSDFFERLRRSGYSAQQGR